MRITEKEFADLKARFEKYFQNVPVQLWFAGRRDAPSPENQVRAVQAMFGIDLSEWGVYSPMVDAGSCYDRELRVAIRRMERWEEEKARIERRKKLLTHA